ncbi:hypothetical protein [Roseobacter sp. S98]|uniref:hypothetical protein n=1 Tax=Roseobacter algicola (ex Choi et al. 2025) (nom. illeg.) TaxID=3092138 RepID=UPI0035C6FD35
MRAELLPAAVALVLVALAVPVILAGPGGAALVLALLGLVFACAVIAAMLRMGGSAQSRGLKDSLRSGSFRDARSRALSYLLSRAYRWIRTEPPGDGTLPAAALLRHALTFGLLDRALLLAVIYPLFTMLLFWGTTGQNVILGQTIVISTASPWWTGPLALAVIALIAGGPHYITIGERHMRGTLKSVAGYLDLIAFGVGGTILIYMDFPWFTTSAILAVSFAALWAFSGFLAGVPAMAVATMLALTGPLGLALQSLLPGPAAFFAATVIALVSALVYLIAVDAFRSRNSADTAGALALCIPVAATIATVIFVPIGETGEWSNAIRIGILVLIVAPVVNAVFDVISFAVTLAFVQRGQQGNAFFWALADIAVALLTFMAAGSTLICTTVALDWLSGTPFIDLEILLDSTWNISRYWWLYLMLFSTLLPSIVHVGITALSLQALTPMRWRENLCARIDAARAGKTWPRVSTPLVLGALWTGCLALVFGAIAGALMVLWNLGLAWSVVWYRQWLELLAFWGGGV